MDQFTYLGWFDTTRYYIYIQFTLSLSFFYIELLYIILPHEIKYTLFTLFNLFTLSFHILMAATAVYLYMVYENYRHYKDYNKFHELSLTTNQVEVKERYIDKDEYKLEFFEVPSEYAEKIFAYIRDKFIRSNFPFNVRNGELQSTLIDFIRKCNSIKEEKASSATTSFSPLTSVIPKLLQPPPSSLSTPLSMNESKLIALIKNKNNGELTVVSETASPAQFFQQLSHYSSLQLLQHAIMPLSEVDGIINTFHKDFQHLKTISEDLNLPWYKMSEVEVLHWLHGRNNASSIVTPSQTPMTSPLSESFFLTPSLFNIDDIILSGTNSTPPDAFFMNEGAIEGVGATNIKKRKMGE